MPSDEKFFALLDGELGPAESARIEAEVAANPELTELAARHRAMQASLKDTFDRILDAPVPAALATAARMPDAEVISFGTRRNRAGWIILPPWAAMAATLAIGIFVGTLIAQRPSAPVEIRGGQIYAAAPLDDALDGQLASAPAGETRINLTFRDQAGAICRSFTSARSSGLACREGKRWQLRGLFGSPEGQRGQYRMAAGMDPTLAALVSSTMAGAPLDAAQEKEAKDKGWR